MLGVNSMERRTITVENMRNIKTGLAFPILSVITPVMKEHANWNRKIIENTDESSTNVRPLCFRKMPRKVLGRIPPVKRKKKATFIFNK